ncbi:NADH-quinone oxidoreductase subunit N [Paenibacillus sp. J31TS4]|uniref:NADH-quinone oxidoreductase subunit N n=1 Tax=Paenibacillus sp. J31TS4 TaxID=2807195 RepID=UPI001B27F4A8|nr:NADH-quinone oxidoreductase subunit N [Paenibacillus sp. J31TS4]GIP40954.1 NADH-quinone oxidoreductase subunit N [Paenibacillus sp. J31TS4]
MEQAIQLSDLGHLAPELTLVISAVLISLLDLFLPSRAGRGWLAWLSIAGIAVSAVFVLLALGLEEPVQLLGQSYRVDDYANLIKLVLLGATALTLFMSIGSVKEEEIPHRSEFYYLFLPALLGGMIMASSADLITLFVGLELLGITSYILVGMSKTRSVSNEAAFKYIVLGGVSSAIILYGMSFLYGMTGTTNLGEIHDGLAANASSFGALLYVSFFLLLAGFGFKIAAAPFHAWAPDVYQGAPTPVAAFLAVVSKAAGFAILFRIVYSVYFQLSTTSELPLSQDAFLSLSVLAAVSMIAGNFMALRQKNLKRLLAYSGIANAGYLLVPIAVSFALVHYSNFSEFYYYLIAYALMNLGVFALILMLEGTAGHAETRGLAGLYHRAPWTAAAVVLVVLSLAGFPVTGGFFGKIFILLGALETKAYWLAFVMILTSVVSFYYYFGLVRQMFMRTGDDEKPWRATVPQRVTLWICAGLGVLLGFFPGTVLDAVQSVFRLGVDLFVY